MLVYPVCEMSAVDEGMDPAEAAEEVSDEAWVVFRVRDRLLALEPSAVVEFVGFEEATPIPQSPPYVLGLLLVRSELWPVCDLGALLELRPDTTISLEERRVILVRVGALQCALLVDGLVGILALRAHQGEAPSETWVERVMAYLTREWRTEGGKVTALDLETLLEDARF